MNSIWLDITSTYAWNRPAVGVIRVETECAKYALRMQDENVRFCRFIAGRGYIELPRNLVEDMLNKFSRIGHGDASARVLDMPPSNSARSGRVVRLAAILRKLTNLLPKQIGGHLFVYLARRKQAVLTLAESARTFRHAIKLWLRPTSSVMLPIVHDEPDLLDEFPFASGDVYVSLGLDWDQKDLKYLARMKRAKGFKTLFCCYDLIPVKFPHLCVGDVASKFAHYFCDLAWCGDEIVSISECSKRDLELLLQEIGAPTPPNTVITLGSDIKQVLDLKVSESVLKTTSDPYILYVSTIERRKNHDCLYKAYTRLIDQGVSDLPKLVFVGMRGWGINDFFADISFDPRIKDRIVILSNIADEDLTWLYRNALFTVFPSLYEGWGLGVAESLANGKMCLASNGGSLPEVGGDLVEYIDPLDIPMWAERIRWYVENPSKIKEVEARIQREYEPPKWSDTAKQVFERARGLLTS